MKNKQIKDTWTFSLITHIPIQSNACIMVTYYRNNNKEEEEVLPKSFLEDMAMKYAQTKCNAYNNLDNIKHVIKKK